MAVSAAAPTVAIEGREYVAILEADPDLRATIPVDQIEAARERLLALRVSADPGPWEPDEGDPDGPGLLVLSGLLTRDVEVTGTRSRELLGSGDIIRPWDNDAELSPVPTIVSWTVLQPASLAVLDGRFALLAGRWPALGSEITRRILRRSRWLAVRLAISNLRGVHDQVMLLFWHLAGNWGRVTPEGTLLPLELTHETIAELLGARRPSVTTAISELRRAEQLERADEGWLLRAEPPGVRP